MCELFLKTGRRYLLELHSVIFISLSQLFDIVYLHVPVPPHIGSHPPDYKQETSPHRCRRSIPSLNSANDWALFRNDRTNQLRPPRETCPDHSLDADISFPHPVSDSTSILYYSVLTSYFQPPGEYPSGVDRGLQTGVSCRRAVECSTSMYPKRANCLYYLLSYYLTVPLAHP